MSPTATDPTRDLASLRPVAEKSAASGRAATEAGEDGRGYAAEPARTSVGPMAGLVVLELRSTDAAALQAAVREVHWAIGWLTSRHWQGAHDLEAEKVERAGIALDLLALVNEHPRPEAAATALVNELKVILDCDQVTVGKVRGRRSPRVRLLAMSYAAWFKRRSTLAKSLETVMDEAQDRGVICVERRDDAPYTLRQVRIAESVAALMGPILELKRRNRRWIGGRLVDKTGHVLGILLGPRRLNRKLLACAIGALIVAAAKVQGSFRISTDAVLQGEVRLAAVAPSQGFVAEAPVRAGDRVAEGALLARLDDRDLRLEQLR